MCWAVNSGILYQIQIIPKVIYPSQPSLGDISLGGSCSFLLYCILYVPVPSL